MKKEIFIAFATQKGGIGKTSVTVLVASYLHYVKGYNVAIVDCDYPQNSVADIRDREVKLIEEDPYFKALAYNHFKKVKKLAYPIVSSNPIDALGDVQEMLDDEQEKIDIVLFDLPGTLKSEGVVSTLAQMDYIFAPFSADRIVVESTLQFASMFTENMMTTGLSKAKGLYLFWTMVDGREKSELYKIYENIIEEMGLSILNTKLPDSKRFRRDLSTERKTIFRSTLFPIDRVLLKGSRIKDLSDEICEIINQK